MTKPLPFPPIAATVTLPISDEVCRDFLTAACEGGSNYWLRCKRLVRDADLNVLEIIGCRDSSGEMPKGEDNWGDANLDTIRLGIQRMMDPAADIASDIREAVLALLVDKDSTSWDAWTADAALQFGLLGKIVFG